jgi:hypothetical protein
MRFGSAPLVAGSDEKHWNICAMTHTARDAAKDKVGDEAVPMSGHGDQIALYLFGEFNYFVCRFSPSQMRGGDDV